MSDLVWWTLLPYGVGVMCTLVAGFGLWSDARNYRDPVERKTYARLILLAPVWPLLVLVQLGKLVRTLVRDALGPPPVEPPYRPYRPGQIR